MATDVGKGEEWRVREGQREREGGKDTIQKSSAGSMLKYM